MAWWNNSKLLYYCLPCHGQCYCILLVFLCKNEPQHTENSQNYILFSKLRFGIPAMPKVTSNNLIFIAQAHPTKK